ncbi:Golgi-associated RAB2 interactor protein 5B-like isoform X6 [Monodelphis domestica]|uniref:Golgi-associated RAB2 interactor protein 5B-like isoform X6 n=1 Tax=Monodelphis domestica TaxID=13616 RepID=UPI0024E24130|nr:Golgi-associated RAB2 interactor protein 5B-like isoform X6 [Monodelphis domestica]
MEIMLGQRHLRESNSLWPGSPESLYRGPWWLLEVPLKRQRGPGEAATASSYSPAQRLQSFPQSPCLECGLPVLPSPELAEQRALGFGSELCRKGPGAPPETGPNFRVAPPHPLCVQGLERTFLRGAAPFFLVLPCMGPGECCQLAPPDPPDPCMRSQRGPPGCVTPARLPLLSSAVPESHSQSALPAESILALLQQPPPPPPQSPDLQAHRDSLSPMKPRKPSPVVLPGELHLPEVEAELSFPLCFPKPGPLQRAVAEGNYPPLGPFTAMFESDFLQVTNKGEPVFLHKKENPVTMAVASSFPGLLLPDLVLLARPVQSKKQPPRLELTRLLPAQLVRLFVHSEAGWRLKLRLASGRSFYLRLVAEPAEGCLLFNRWRFLIFLMQGPIPAWARSPDEQAAQDESAPMSAAEAPPKRKEVAFPPQYPVPRTKGSPGWTWDKALHYPGPLSQLMDQQSAPALPEVMSRAEAAPMSFRSQQKLPVRREEQQKRSTPGSLVEVEGCLTSGDVLFRALQATLPRAPPGAGHCQQAAAPPRAAAAPGAPPRAAAAPGAPPRAAAAPGVPPRPAAAPGAPPRPAAAPRAPPRPAAAPGAPPRPAAAPGAPPRPAAAPGAPPRAAAAPGAPPRPAAAPGAPPRAAAAPRAPPRPAAAPGAPPRAAAAPGAPPRPAAAPGAPPRPAAAAAPRGPPREAPFQEAPPPLKTPPPPFKMAAAPPRAATAPKAVQMPEHAGAATAG